MAIARFLKQLVPSPPYPDLPRPKAPLCIVGDVHGCETLLSSMLARLTEMPDRAHMRVVFVGDMVDRGAGSATVLNSLRALGESSSPFAQTICLMGNHERMMLDFLHDPLENGPRWLSNGGDKTLESFGLSANRPIRRPGPSDHSGDQTAPLVALRDMLLGAMPDGLHDWILNRPLLWRDEGIAVAHAGANPTLSIEQQSERDLLWGHRAFRNRRRDDGLWIAHGHYIVTEPSAVAGRIALDTGAYLTGRLTAVRLDENGVQFIEVQSPDAEDAASSTGNDTDGL